MSSKNNVSRKSKRRVPSKNEALAPPRPKSPTMAAAPAPVMDADLQRGCTCAFPWLSQLLGVNTEPANGSSVPPVNFENEPLGGQEAIEQQQQQQRQQPYAWTAPAPPLSATTSSFNDDLGKSVQPINDDYRPISVKAAAPVRRPPTLVTSQPVGSAPPPLPIDLPEPDSPSSSVNGGSPRPVEDFAAITTASTPTSQPMTYFSANDSGGPIEVLIQNFKLAFSEGQKVVIHSKELNPRKGLLFIEGDDICWNFFSAYYALKKGLRRMPLSEVVAINPGKTGEAFKRKTAEDVAENRCLTVVSNNKALAVQFANSVVAEAFTMGVQLYLSHKTAKSPTSTSARLAPTAAP